MMKQNKLITLIVLTITVICSSLPLQGQTKLYNQYKHRTDMVVMCVMDYPLTDSIKTDITLFQPLTPDHLWPMVQEFNIINLEKDMVNHCYGNDKNTPLYFYNVKKDNIKEFYGIVSSDKDCEKIAILVYNYSEGILIILHDIDTKERERQIISFLIEATTDSDILPQMKK